VGGTGMRGAQECEKYGSALVMQAITKCHVTMSSYGQAKLAMVSSSSVMAAT
jgi:hypothetical protein